MMPTPLGYEHFDEKSNDLSGPCWTTGRAVGATTPQGRTDNDDYVNLRNASTGCAVTTLGSDIPERSQGRFEDAGPWSRTPDAL